MSNKIARKRFGRESFQAAMKLVQRVAPSNIDWSRLKFMVFDAPNHTGAYGERYHTLGMCLHFIEVEKH